MHGDGEEEKCEKGGAAIVVQFLPDDRFTPSKAARRGETVMVVVMIIY